MFILFSIFSFSNCNYNLNESDSSEDEETSEIENPENDDNLQEGNGEDEGTGTGSGENPGTGGGNEGSGGQEPRCQHEYDYLETFEFNEETENDLVDGKWTFTCNKCHEKATVPGTIFDRGSSRWGYDKLGEEEYGYWMQNGYVQLFKACEEFLTDFETDFSGENQKFYDKFTLWFPDSIESSINIPSGFIPFISRLTFYFAFDNPCYYWLAKGYGMGAFAHDQNMYYIMARLSLNATSFNLGEDRKTYWEKCIEMQNDFKRLISEDDSDAVKAKKAHDFICDRIDFLYDDQGNPSMEGFAHTIAGCADSSKNGVCECYAKTYSFLCNSIGLKCLLVNGWAMGGSHAWNYVQVNDSWYPVDCTWDDMRGDYEYFGKNENGLFVADHFAGKVDYGGELRDSVNELYPLPTLSESNLLDLID